jgi:flagellar basal-body rod protein FlgB
MILIRDDNLMSRGRFSSRCTAAKRLKNKEQVFGFWLAPVDGVLDPVTSQIEHYMDLLSARQKLVAANIANVDTPGYKTQDIDFQFEFMSLAPGAKPHVVDTPGLAVHNDGNNVSMDREARLLAENALRFNLASSLMKAQLKLVNAAINEGKSG